MFDYVILKKPARWYKWKKVCLWCERYRVQISSRSNLPHVTTNSPLLQPQNVGTDAKPQRWPLLTCDTQKSIKQV